MAAVADHTPSPNTTAAAAAQRIAGAGTHRRGAAVTGVPPVLVGVTFLGGVYGAYFGGALGVILLAAAQAGFAETGDAAALERDARAKGAGLIANRAKAL